MITSESRGIGKVGMKKIFKLIKLKHRWYLYGNLLSYVTSKVYELSRSLIVLTSFLTRSMKNWLLGHGACNGVINASGEVKGVKKTL